MPKAPNIQPNLVQVAWALNLYRLGNDVAGVFIPLVILKSGGKLWMIGLFYLLYAFIKSGNGRMPNFNLNDTEIHNLIAFLKWIDKSGKSKVPKEKVTWSGNYNLEQ